MISPYLLFLLYTYLQLLLLVPAPTPTPAPTAAIATATVIAPAAATTRVYPPTGYDIIRIVYYLKKFLTSQVITSFHSLKLNNV